MAVKISKIQFKRGIEANKGFLDPGEPFVSNEGKVFVGSLSGEVELTRIPQRDTEPNNAQEGDLWLDTSDNAFQGTVFESLNQSLAEKAKQTDVDALTSNLAEKAKQSDLDIASKNIVNIESYPIQTPEVDDLPRIRRAYNALVALGGGVLRVSKLYNISDTFQVTNSNISVIGDGWHTGFKQTTAGKMTIYAHTVGIKNVKFKDFSIDGNGNGQLDVGALAIENIFNFVVDTVEVKNTPIRGNGISVSQVDTVGTVKNCEVHHCGKGGIYAATGAAFMLIENNHVHDITNVGKETANDPTAFDIPGIQVIGGINTKVINNRTYNCTGAGVYLMTGGYYQTLQDTPLNELVHGNTSYNNKYGIYIANAYPNDIQASETRAVVQSNHCYQNTDSGIRIENRDNVSLDNNHCFDNINGTNGVGIVIKNTKNVSMNGNHTFDNPYSGIQLDGVKNITMTNNHAYVYNGTQTRGLTFAGAVSDIINMGFNDFNNIIRFTEPTNVKAAFNNTNDLDRVFSKTTSLPTANSSRRGLTYVIEGGTGVADKTYQCRKQADETYAWVEI